MTVFTESFVKRKHGNIVKMPFLRVSLVNKYMRRFAQLQLYNLNPATLLKVTLLHGCFLRF